ncbi:ABC transporter ATP-binding protein [candidate division KSB1 bacterium]|nr:ABC transporter ATP-binding protein [candidate division KSB1 bacterium]
MNDISVSTKNLSKRFGNFTAVDQISFDVRRGEIFGFLGANGAGKTTTIRMLCGLLIPSSGEAWVNGLDVNTESETIKRQIGYMSQKFSLYQDLTISENIDFYGGIYELSDLRLKQRKDYLLSILGLEAHRHKLTRDIPLGWKQGLALGCAIIHEPPVLFLDEPTSGVDPLSRRRFWALINELAQQDTTIFVTTHYMDEAEYCNRLSIMHQGKIITIDSPGALKNMYHHRTIEDVFIHLITNRI